MARRAEDICCLEIWCWTCHMHSLKQKCFDTPSVQMTQSTTFTWCSGVSSGRVIKETVPRIHCLYQQSSLAVGKRPRKWCVAWLLFNNSIEFVVWPFLSFASYVSSSSSSSSSLKWCISLIDHYKENSFWRCTSIIHYDGKGHTVDILLKRQQSPKRRRSKRNQV